MILLKKFIVQKEWTKIWNINCEHIETMSKTKIKYKDCVIFFVDIKKYSIITLSNYCSHLLNKMHLCLLKFFPYWLIGRKNKIVLKFIVLGIPLGDLDLSQFMMLVFLVITSSLMYEIIHPTYFDVRFTYHNLFTSSLMSQSIVHGRKNTNPKKCVDDYRSNNLNQTQINS